MKCKYIQDELCTNPDCPMCADYCPVPDTEDVCKYEGREEDRWALTPKGCFMAALNDSQVCFSESLINEIWENFCRYMKRMGYIQEEK